MWETPRQERGVSETPFYKNTRDTLAEVGITNRQLSYWRKEGLLKPELRDGKRFTESDIEQLNFLKRLIVDFGLSAETVRRMTEEGIRTWKDRPSSYLNWRSARYLN